MSLIFNILVLFGVFLVSTVGTYGLSLWPWYRGDDQSSGMNGNRKLSKMDTKNDKPIAIFGAPFWMGQKIEGTHLAPDLFRKQNIVDQIKLLGYDSVVDYGNLEFKDNPKDESIKFRNNFTEIHKPFTSSDAYLLVESKVEQILTNGETLVVLGGDHSITAGSILGHKKVKSDICVIYVDAHGDLNHCESTTSGNLHGMPLSFVIKGMEKLHKNFKSCPPMNVLKPSVEASDVVLIASRDLDELEFDIINELNVSHFSMKDFDEFGVKQIVNQILNTVCKSKSIHISFDIDSLDVAYTPNTGTAVFGGFTVREVLQMAEMIANTNQLKVIEMFEVNPSIGPKDSADTTTNIAMNIILAFLGKPRELNWARPWLGGWGERQDH